MGINDNWLFFYVYPVLAILAVHVGNDNSFRDLLKTPSYYSDLVLALFCAYGAGIYFRKLFSRVSRTHDFISIRQELLRFLVLWGIFVPVSVLTLTELVYLMILGVPWSTSSIWYLEVPLFIIFCILVNLLYYTVYHRKQLIETVPKTLPAPEEKANKEHFLVSRGKQNLIIPVTQIAYFVMQNGLTFLVTEQGNRWLYDTPLRDLNLLLPKDTFFQLNRQLVASKKSILKYVQTDTRRLEVVLHPPFSEPQYVAKNKSAEFTNWLNNNLLSA